MAAKDIFEAVLTFKHKEVSGLVQKEVDSGTEISEILDDGLIAAMDELGRKFSAGTLFVPEMLIGAISMKNGLAVLKPILARANTKAKGTIIIGTVKGDQHDVGKNLVGMMLEGAGFKVVDLGVDQDTAAFITAVEENDADIVALSCLLTTCMPSMKTIVTGLRENIKDIKTMVGGAPISPEFTEQIGAAGYGKDGVHAVETARGLLAE